jgi:hypothetical protein
VDDDPDRSTGWPLVSCITCISGTEPDALLPIDAALATNCNRAGAAGLLPGPANGLWDDLPFKRSGASSAPKTSKNAGPAPRRLDPVILAFVRERF